MEEVVFVNLLVEFIQKYGDVVLQECDNEKKPITEKENVEFGADAR